MGCLIAAGWLLNGTARAQATNAKPDALLADGAAFAKSWEAPDFPADLQRELRQGQVVVHVIVTPQGTLEDPRVISSSDKRLEPHALAALSRATFEPAIEANVPVASCIAVTIPFQANQSESKLAKVGVDALPVERPVPIVAPDADYPPGYVDKLLDGRVEAGFVIDREGGISEIQIRGATSPIFIGPALEALRQWRFKPARQGHLTVVSRQETGLDFGAVTMDVQGLKKQTLEGFGLRPVDTPPSWTSAPEVVRVEEPVIPHEVGVAGGSGEAEVEFTVSTAGGVTNVTVLEGPNPSLGRALAVAVRGCWFKPAANGNEKVEARLRLKWTFQNPLVEGPRADLWQLLASGQTVGSPRGLDRRLRPVSQESPRYPEALRAEGLAGTAKIEFIIDRTGRARLPRVLEASRPEFGDEAVQAVSYWFFDPPTRQGEPTDVRVVIPMQFAAPKNG